MKGFILMLIVASLFVSCKKEASVSKMDEQRGRKSRVESVALSVNTSFPLGEDDIVSVDSVKYEQNGNFTGNDVFWSVRSSDLPSVQLVIQVWIEAGVPDKFGVSSSNSHWGTIGSLWDGHSITGSGGAGSIFDGYPTSNETRIYRAEFIDVNGVAHFSSAYQVN